jgi:hypothetical protein
MNDLVRVHTVAGTDELIQEEASLRFSEAASAMKHVYEGTTWTQLERHIHVALVLEAILEADNIGMLECAVYLCLEKILCDDLAGNAETTDISDFINACKSALRGVRT